MVVVTQKLLMSDLLIHVTYNMQDVNNLNWDLVILIQSEA